VTIALVLGVASVTVLMAVGIHAAARTPQDQIAYVSAGKIRVGVADGSGSRELATGGSPSWSPDGTAITFHSARVRGYGLDVYVMNRDGSDQRRLVTHPTAGGEPSDNTHDDFDPTWSPDGSFIAFVTYRNGNAEIYRMDTTGHATARLTTNPADDLNPAWSPDGRTIAFVSDRSGNADVYAMRADSTDVRRLTEAAEADSNPAWSPDGRTLAFESARGGNADLYVVAADGSGENRLTSDPAADTHPTWSADGKSIAFTRTDVSGRHLVLLDVATGVTRPLTPPSESADAPNWQPGVDLALSVSRSRSLRRGQPAHLRLDVRNELSAPAFSVAVTISIPKAARVLRTKGSGVRCRRGRPLRCFVRMLSSSRTVSAELFVRPSRCGTFTVRASVASLQRDVDGADNQRTARFRVAC
jgi:Tol biopolymer transport system component